jgi:hypothetical protein
LTRKEGYNENRKIWKERKKISGYDWSRIEGPGRRERKLLAVIAQN